MFNHSLSRQSCAATLLVTLVAITGCGSETPEIATQEKIGFRIENVSLSRDTAELSSNAPHAASAIPGAEPFKIKGSERELNLPSLSKPATEEDRSAKLEHDSPFPADKCTGKPKPAWMRSPLAYAIPKLTPKQERQRYETLVKSIEGSSPTGRTLQFQPTIQPQSLRRSELVSPDDADFWSFRPLSPLPPPTINDSSFRIANPIDAFIAAELMKEKLSQNPVAATSGLLRRVFFDTIGLPPSSAEHQSWVSKLENSTDDEAYSQLIERLLSDTAFGERWSRFWLDLARYADSDGYEEDDLRPRAFTYRDFATWAMNADLPFKLFIQWQIAGDQLEPSNPMAVAATGFLAGSPINTFFPQESERYDELDDMVSTMGRAMLGITIGCARCHEHEYDPIPIEDYYSLISVFRTTQRAHPVLLPDGGERYQQTTAPVTEKRAEILQMLLDSLKENNIEDLEEFTDAEKDLLRQPVDPSNQQQARLLSKCMRCIWVEIEHLEHDTPLLDKFKERYAELIKAIDELQPHMPPPAPTGLAIRGGKFEPFFVLQGGELKKQTTRVNPGFLTALTKSTPKWERDTWKQWAPDHITTDELYPRTTLAIWLTDTQNGAGALVARVIVNRLWQQYFGRGIVDTPSDFGLLGASPSHPELLEWLAAELVENDWSLRHIHRLILNSATYQQSCNDSVKACQSDPTNTLLWRQNPKRLTAEMLRDSMLAIGDNLNRKMYGPGIMPQIPRAAILNTQESARDTWPMLRADDPESFRRSLYIVTKRSMSVPLMKLFDAPDGSISCETRTTTTVPTQALALWNSRFIRNQSQRVANVVIDSLENESATMPNAITSTYQRILLREPTQRESEQCLAFMRSLPVDAPVQQLTELCHVLLMSNEFVYLP